jgi:hypothetical protein
MAGTISVFDNENASFDGQLGPDVLIVNGGPTVTMPASQNFSSLTVNSGASASLDAGGNKYLRTLALSMANTARLDLNDNDMIVDYPGSSQLAMVQALINSARNNGAWNGFGITSTAAKNNPQHSTTLGAMEAIDYDSVYGNGALFNGIDPDNTAALVKYTYYGDADFSGEVDFDDYARTDSGFNNNRTGWLNGDFDGNGIVDFDDLVLLDLGFNSQSGTL